MTLNPNQLTLPKIIDIRPDTILKEIAPNQERFALILFDIKDTTDTNQLIGKLESILGTTDFKVWIDSTQLILLCCAQSPNFDQKITRIEQLLDCKTGVAYYPEDGKSLQGLSRKAYQASRHDFIPNFRQSILRAIDNDELFLLYQPQMNTFSGQYIGAEALIRWQHPTKNRVVMPLEFLPQAEDEGLMGTICKWTLYEACRQNLAWQALGRHIPVSVNISTTYLLNPTFISDLDQVLKETNINPKILELELTENNLITKNNVAKVNSILDAVRNRGVKVSLDDFGMEYNSLELLRVLTVDKIKIDKVFVQNVETPKVRAIVQATIALSRAMDLDCIAEGVETSRQVAILEKMGCPDMQGFLIGRPQKEIPDWKNQSTG